MVHESDSFCQVPLLHYHELNSYHKIYCVVSQLLFLVLIHPLLCVVISHVLTA